jgi:hypothetical protein
MLRKCSAYHWATPSAPKWLFLDKCYKYLAEIKNVHAYKEG